MRKKLREAEADGVRERVGEKERQRETDRKE